MDLVYLFSPGDSRRKIEKALNSTADVIILDLEDGVAEAHKELARHTILSTLEDIRKNSNQEKKIFIRINPITSPHFFADLRMAKQIQVDGIMIPKCEGSAEIQIIQEWKLSLEIIPLIESAAGIENLASIVSASRQIRRVAFGAVDFMLDLGAEWTVEGEERKYVMGQLIYKSRVLGLSSPIDAVFPQIHDKAALQKDARFGRMVGFHGKMIIHPEQIDWIREVYQIPDEQRRLYEEIVQIYEQADSIGSMEVGGKLIDLPIYRRAKRVLDSLR
jgi:citrate lyase subunit beta/citryl-CoA lyase